MDGPRFAHLGEPPAPGRVRVDMHVHTMWSGDSTTTPDEIAEAVIRTGVDVICVTDHHSVEGALSLARSLPCRVVIGEEIATHTGELIGLFLTERIPQGLTAAETAVRIRGQGGIVYVPHPFDPMRRNLALETLEDLTARGLIDAVEVMNAKTSLDSLNVEAALWARDHHLAAGAGSDCHVPEALAAAVVEMPDFDGPESFMAALADGNPTGCHHDPPRRWKPRIIPSTGR